MIRKGKSHAQRRQARLNRAQKNRETKAARNKRNKVRAQAVKNEEMQIEGILHSISHLERKLAAKQKKLELRKEEQRRADAETSEGERTEAA